MRSFIKRRTLQRVIREKLKKIDGVQELSKIATDYLIDYLDKEIEVVINEAVNGNYYRVLPIDMNRGIEKFEKQVIEKRTGKAFEVIRRLII